MTIFVNIFTRMENQLTFLRDVSPRITASGSKHNRAEYICSCGNKCIKTKYEVASGRIKNCSPCGKLLRIKSKTTHGLVKHHLYGRWQDMKNRCRNEKTDRYGSYGGRGIKVCDEWANDFQVYYDWCISNGWVKGMSVDRIDVDGDYEPENCQVIPIAGQNYNKRNTFYVFVDDKKYSLALLLRNNNLSHKYSLIHKQITRMGWTFDIHIQKYNIQTINTVHFKTK